MSTLSAMVLGEQTMTDTRAATQKDAPNLQEYEIIPNQNAPRFAVDTSVPIFLGVDFEVALFTTSPDFTGKSIAVERNEDGISGRLRLPAPSTGKYLEIGRLRMNAQSTEQLAYALMLALIRSEYTSPEELRAIVDYGEKNIVNDPSVTDDAEPGI